MSCPVVIIVRDRCGHAKRVELCAFIPGAAIPNVRRVEAARIKAAVGAQAI